MLHVALGWWQQGGMLPYNAGRKGTLGTVHGLATAGQATAVARSPGCLLQNQGAFTSLNGFDGKHPQNSWPRKPAQTNSFRPVLVSFSSMWHLSDGS